MNMRRILISCSRRNSRSERLRAKETEVPNAFFVLHERDPFAGSVCTHPVGLELNSGRGSRRRASNSHGRFLWS